MTIDCPHCHHSATAPDDFAGKSVNCPKCRKRFAAGGAAAFTLAEKPTSVEGAVARGLFTVAIIVLVASVLIYLAVSWFNSYVYRGIS